MNLLNEEVSWSKVHFRHVQENFMPPSIYNALRLLKTPLFCNGIVPLEFVTFVYEAGY